MDGWRVSLIVWGGWGFEYPVPLVDEEGLG